MKWLNVESVRFPDHGAILTICRVDAVNFHNICAALSQYRDGETPEALARTVSEIVDLARPELSGHTLWMLSFEQHTQTWEIGILHPSLPAVEIGCELPRMPLFQPTFVDAGHGHGDGRTMGKGEI